MDAILKVTGLSPTVPLPVAEQPFPSRTLTVYVPAPKPLTVAVVAPPGVQEYVKGAIEPTPGTAVTEPIFCVQKSGITFTVAEGFATVIQVVSEIAFPFPPAEQPDFKK